MVRLDAPWLEGEGERLTHYENIINGLANNVSGIIFFNVSEFTIFSDKIFFRTI